MPLLLLILVEGCLRLVGYGQSIPLFVSTRTEETTSETALLMPNPRIIERYFHHPELAPKVSPDTFLFSLEKPKDTLRIVVMGGSSAAGFPYGRFGSPTGMLNQQLKFIYPNKNIELISVAMASINSYALRDFANEVASISPDAVLIYAGHNEYLGVMGVGSNFASYGGHWANLTFNFLRDFRLFQLLQNVLTQTPSSEQVNQQKSQGRTVMATVAKEKNIPLNSPLYKLGLDQFESNMAAILALFRNRDIPVYIGNLVSNEQHQPPFESEEESKGLNLSASLNFKSGDQSVNQNQYNDAREYYIAARDLDLLRFRAPSDFNGILARIAKEQQAVLVDVDTAVRNDTEHGIIGQKHMLEHLHPTAKGYFVIALAYMEAMQRNLLLPASDLALSDEVINQLWSNIPLNQVDQLFAQYKVAQLTSDYPFKKTPEPYTLPDASNQFEQLAVDRSNGQDWLSQQQLLLSEYQKMGDFSQAAQVASVMFDALRVNHQAAAAASQLYLRENNLRMAHYHARQAVSLASRNIAYRLTYAEVLFKRGLKAQSIAQLDQILRIEPNNPKAQRYLKLIEQGR